jgi:hypothetical protein
MPMAREQGSPPLLLADIRAPLIRIGGLLAGPKRLE